MKFLQSSSKAFVVGLAALLVISFSSVSKAAVAAPAAPKLLNSAAAESDLNFDLVNKTGYDIKAVRISWSGNKDWSDDDDVLHGRTFGSGETLKITFAPKQEHEHWDIQVEWSDGSGTVEWTELKLSDINTVTLHYNKETDKTTAVVE